MAVLRFLALSWIGRALAGVAVVAIVGMAIVAPRLGPATPQPAFRTVTVTRGNVIQTVAVSGSINASALWKVGFKVTGTRLAEVPAKVGQAVKVGDVLGRLDDSDLVLAEKKAEVDLLTAQTKYDQTLAGASAEDIAIAKNAVDTAARSLDDTKRSTANDLAAAEQSFTKLTSAYASDQNAFQLLTSGIAADVGVYAKNVDDARTILANAVIDLSVKSTADLTTAKTSIGQADAALVNAQSVAGSQLSTALTEWKSARDGAISAWLQFDGAIQRGTDTSGATSQFKSAQLAYTTAANRLLAALDSAAASVASASSNITSAQNALNSSNSRSDATLDNLRSDFTGFQTATANETQLSTAIKNKVTQAGTSLATVTDAVGGSYLSARQAVQTAKVKAEQSVAAQENALRSAQLSFQKTTATPKQTDIALAYASVQLARIDRDKAKADLDNATLRAPVAGVIASVANGVGETPANPYVTIAVVSSLVLHGTVGESDIAKLKLGQVATVSVDAASIGTRLTGKVTTLDPVATISQGVPVYGVDVQVDLPDPAVRPGMSGTASVIVASQQGVLTLPNLAIRSTAGQRVVQLLRNGAPEDAQGVQFGISNDTVTEIKTGLTEGDVVVIPAARPAASQRPNQFGPGGGPVIVR